MRMSQLTREYKGEVRARERERRRDKYVQITYSKGTIKYHGNCQSYPSRQKRSWGGAGGGVVYPPRRLAREGPAAACRRPGCCMRVRLRGLRMRGRKVCTIRKFVNRTDRPSTSFTCRAHGTQIRVVGAPSQLQEAGWRCLQAGATARQPVTARGTVAAGMGMYRRTLPAAEDADATVEIISFFNCIFQLLSPKYPF